MTRKRIVCEKGQVFNFDTDSLQEGLARAIAHIENVEKHWAEYAASVNYTHVLDCSRLLTDLRRTLRSNSKTWGSNEVSIARHFSSPGRFGTSSSCIMHNTTIRTVVDVLAANSSVVLVKPPQAGATTVLTGFCAIKRALCFDDDVRVLSTCPNDNTIESQSVSAHQTFMKLYGEIRINDVALNRMEFTTSQHESTTDRDIHKNNHRRIANFCRKLAGGEITLSKNDTIDMNDVVDEIVNSGFSEWIIAIDECQRGSGTKQTLGKQLIILSKAVRKRGGKLSFLLSSATPYEVINTNVDNDVVRIPVWVGENYSGPIVFEGLQINVLGDRTKVKPPVVMTFDEQFDLKSKFGFREIDYTASKLYGRGNDETKITKFVQNEYQTSITQLRKNKNESIYNEALRRHKEYDKFLQKALPYCIKKAFEFQKNEEFQGLAVRLPSNTLAHQFVEEWKLSDDIKVIKCFDNENEINKRKCNPAELVEMAIKEGYKKFVIVHTGGGRMGAQFPSECRYFLDTTSRTEETDPLLQGYFGRGCGHNKRSTYIGSTYNVERHLRPVLETGMSPKSKPSVRSRKLDNDTHGMYGWLLRKVIGSHNQFKKFIPILDKKLGEVVADGLKRYNETPKEFLNKWKNKRSHNIKTNEQFSSDLIETLGSKFWDLVEANPSQTTNIYETPFRRVKPLRIKGTAEEQRDLVRRWKLKQSVPAGFITSKGMVASPTIGLRFWPGSLKDPSAINVGGQTQDGEILRGDTSIKRGEEGSLQIQIVWDFDEDRCPRFVGWKYVFLETMVLENPVHATDSSVYKKLGEGHDEDEEDWNFGGDGVYETTGKKISAKVTKNGKVVIHKGSQMAYKQTPTCPAGAINIRETLKNSKSLKRAGDNYHLVKDVYLPEDISIQALGCALYGCNRTANSIWRRIENVL